jgi:serine/threonine protein kinase
MVGWLYDCNFSSLFTDTLQFYTYDKCKYSQCKFSEHLCNEKIPVVVLKTSNFFRYIFIVMEYCEHGDLSRFIRKRRKLPETVCKKFLQQLALALKFLRSQNVCHMDLKPQNLLLTSKPNLTLKLAGKYAFMYLHNVR